MEKPKIAFDLDDSLLDTTRFFLQYCNERLGTNYKFEDLDIYHLEKKFGISGKERYDLEIGFYKSSYGINIPLKPGAKAIINLFREIFDIHIITARPYEWSQYVMNSLSQHFDPNDFSHVHVIKSLDGSCNLAKWEVCEKHGIQLLIDDYDLHVNLAAEKGVQGILLSAPWNKNAELHPLVERANDLYEVMNFTT